MGRDEPDQTVHERPSGRRAAPAVPARRSAAATILLGALVAAGCDGRDGREPGGERPAPVVEVATPEVREVVRYVEAQGFLEAIEEVAIRARVAGRLERVAFEESSRVEAGQVLFEIEREPYAIAARRAEAILERTRAEARLAEARLERAREAFAQDAVNEIEKLEYEAALEEAEAAVGVAEAELARARLDLSYTEVVSPIDGRVDRAAVDAGNLVGRGEATLLARVVRMDPIEVRFEVSEPVALEALAEGRDGVVGEDAPPVEVGLLGREDFPFRGRLSFVDNVLDSDTGTLRVRGRLPNPDGRLYPGLFARVRVPQRTESDAIVIHEEALVSGLGGRGVLVVDGEGTVERRSVVVGRRLGDGRVVVREGLAGDERYVVRGVQKARPGRTVRTRPFAPDAGGAAGGSDSGAGGSDPAAGDADDEDDVPRGTGGGPDDDDGGGA